ncbi:MAG: YkgJ family cysteine cluster protein [Deltaproteobacteria bacterium]|nr:YkgJ family cysteine cluster protein [Deltaproteobacteria bacterium]MBW1957476.1 YkgJ family cysteine cluster protein [Deltaproteobacteria bacterium]MBW2012949.1 YkgJ family cysteine cluster protein [Deltaproteobacteria bacterium]MBW2087702.1 YkgJ family cysteine cluster protein [Deltaproteobacteria bacterium]
MIDQAVIHPIKEGKFRFTCHNGLPCFTKCCANLNLVLTPYDVLRLKNRLNLSSQTFLDRYTTSFVDEKYGVPVVKLKMNNDETRQCPFVKPEGCVVYEDRPGACRLYPLGQAASMFHGGHQADEYYFIVKEPYCLGLNEEQEWTVPEWLTNQGLDKYNTMNQFFMDITAGRPSKIIKRLNDRQLRMYYMACYCLDDFRNFVFETSFLDKFDIAQDVLNRIKTDETELMAFACQWLKFSLFGEKTFQLAVTELG